MSHDPRATGYVQTDQYRPPAPKNTMHEDAGERLAAYRRRRDDPNRGLSAEQIAANEEKRQARLASAPPLPPVAVAPIDWEVINTKCAEANAKANLSSHQRAERRRVIEEAANRMRAAKAET